mgnify:CR=1 FL=1
MRPANSEFVRTIRSFANAVIVLVGVYLNYNLTS